MQRVLEVGGTHVTSALVDPERSRVVRSQRSDLDSSADRATLLTGLVAAARGLGGDADGLPLTVAIPGPFDYARGVGNFEGVEKFGALKDVAVGDHLSAELGVPVTFLNDVTAYAIGEYELHGRPRRFVALTLGTGVGSCFLDNGEPVDSGADVPPHGWVYLLEWEGRPLEDTFSRRAIARAHAAATGEHHDVRAIAELARDGDDLATGVLTRAYGALAETISPWLVRFGADVVVVGGSIAQSWDLTTRWFTPRVEEIVREAGAEPPYIEPGSDGETAALIGAAQYGEGHGAAG
ncbi:ROK family protein [Propioniciclava soli]|uniref:ROK family protein n=1 Tax=Propioniciclava soli TaxID=2775081 RepID=A0ABZ3CBY9_9ACTN